MRSKRGSTAAEFPLIMWALFVLVLYPILDLTSCSIRSYAVYSATHNAALMAAKATTFRTSFPPNESSIDAANTVVNRIASTWTGVRVATIRTFLVTTNVTSKAETITSSPLLIPPNTAQNVYHIRVVVTADIDPLLTFNLPLFGTVPGLTGPFRVTMQDQNFVENTQGLTQ